MEEHISARTRRNRDIKIVWKTAGAVSPRHIRL
jgi:hypothetical protein